MDAFYASVEQLRRPELRGKPVAVGHNGPRGVVAAASYEARRFGVHSAMPAAIARRLCPQAIWVEPDFKTYGDYSRKVFGVLDRYTPLVQPMSLDEAFLDLSGDRRARAEPEAVGAELKAAIKQETGGLTASAGIAGCKLVAKVASDFQKPDGLTIVPPGGEAAFFAPLPLRRLPGLGPAAERRLEGLGLHTIGDIAALPEAVLTERFGTHGPELGLRARGVDDSPVMLPGPPKSISREVTFEKDITDREQLRQILRGLQLDVTRSLRGHGMWAKTVRLKLRFAGFETHTYQATMAAPSNIDSEFLEMAEGLLLEALREPRPVRLIGVGAAGLSESVQETLFDATRARRHALDESLDRLRTRFGPGAISRGQTAPGRQRDFRRDDIDAVRNSGA